MQEYTIEPLDIKDYDKCNNIWDMKKGFDTVISDCEDEHGKYYKLLKRL